MKVVTVKLPEDLNRRLSNAAERTGVSKSSLVRDAVQAYLNDQAPKGTEPTVFEVAAEVIGKAVGPRLTATHPERMKGYGG